MTTITLPKLMPSRNLITIEGGEGAGKSTAIETVASVLREAGYEVVTTREPGGTQLGESLREIIKSTDHPQGICQDAELLMLFASRSQHLHETIMPALARGAVVICDRFTDSTYAYQGGGRRIPTRTISMLESVFVGLQPYLTLLLDTDVSVGRQRAKARGLGSDRIEEEADDFFLRVRAYFCQRAAAHPERFRVIDASQGIDAVGADVADAVRHWIAKDQLIKSETGSETSLFHIQSTTGGEQVIWVAGTQEQAIQEAIEIDEFSADEPLQVREIAESELDTLHIHVEAGWDFQSFGGSQWQVRSFREHKAILGITDTSPCQFAMPFKKGWRTPRHAGSE